MSTSGAPEPAEYDSGDDDDGIGESFVISVVVSWVVGGILAFRDEVTQYLLDAQDAFLFALESGGGAVAGAITTVGSVPLFALDALDAALSAVAASAGPFAPLVVAVAWALAAFAVLALLRFLLWIVPLVIPWL